MSLDNGISPQVFIHEDGVEHRQGATPQINGLYLPVNAAFSMAKGSTNICLATITIQDNALIPNTILRPQNFKTWLSDSANGAGLTAVTPSGGITVNGSNGAVLGIMTASKALQAQSLANGTFILQITDTAKTGFYIAVELPNGLIAVSRQLMSADYG